jgi:hypothetical protein
MRVQSLMASLRGGLANNTKRNIWSLKSVPIRCGTWPLIHNSTMRDNLDFVGAHSYTTQYEMPSDKADGFTCTPNHPTSYFVQL